MSIRDEFKRRLRYQDKNVSVASYWNNKEMEQDSINKCQEGKVPIVVLELHKIECQRIRGLRKTYLRWPQYR